MKHIFQKKPYIEQNKLVNYIVDEASIFFDIETTGFSPATSTVYLIGCLRKQGDEWIIDQFLAESKEDEKEILNQFVNLLSQYNTIITFNGIGFDIPFIKAKCVSYGISCYFDSFQYVDIFKEVGKLKSILNLPNYKQKTIEQFLGITREDIYSGGELIPMFEKYISTHDPYAEELLLLHNYEDVLGMLDLIPILSYPKLLSGSFRIKSSEISSFTAYDGNEGTELIFTLENDYILPKRVSFQCSNYFCIMNQNETKIQVPIYDGELKYFYENYKEYYYLPEEDMAIHKSVATFVDKEYRQKAKACNCYTRKAGRFLPQFYAFHTPAFRANYKDKVSYFEITKDFLSNDIALRAYIKHIFDHAMKN
jgi:uncharacterized protein YprB with RNaseH-like and TPR domain